MTVLDAIRNAIKVLPARSKVKSDLKKCEKILNWRKRRFSEVAESGAVVLYFDDKDKDPQKRALHESRARKIS